MPPFGVYGGVYGMAVYEKATLSKRSGRKNWYVYCTVPIPLRGMMGGAKQIHISTGTSDLEFARDKWTDEYGFAVLCPSKVNE